MLELVAGIGAKKAAHSALRKAMHAALPAIGTHTVGFPGGNFDHPLRGEGDQGLWFHGEGPYEGHKIKRHINTLGIFRASAASQDVTVEINIPSDTNTQAVAGFFAKDSETGATYLMHTGGVGGGRRGIGKQAFLQWSRLKQVAVVEPDGAERTGIIVTGLEGNVLARVRRFVRTVHDFKLAVRDKGFDAGATVALAEEADRYTKEFSGWKSGTRSAGFEYISYHGDIVDALYQEAKSSGAGNAVVGSSGLIDLFICRSGRISDLYEVKTAARRQALYTAIGQLVTHSAALPGEVLKWLVVPAEEQIAADLVTAIKSLGIRVRRFKLDEAGDDPKIVLLPAGQ